MGRVYRPPVNMHFGLGKGCERCFDQRGFENFIVVRGALSLLLFVQARLRVTGGFGEFPAGASQAEQGIVQVGFKSLMHRSRKLEFQARRGIADQSDNIVQRRSNTGMPPTIERLDK